MERIFVLETLCALWFALSRGAGEKEDAADLVSSLSSYEETVTLPWNIDTSGTVEVRKLNLSRAELLSQLAFSNKHFKSLDVQLALRKCGTLTKLGWTFENMGNEPSSSSMLVRPLMDRHGIFVSTDSL